MNPFKRWARMIQCQHLHAFTIYGDEIIAVGYRRGHCPECDAWLWNKPQTITVPELKEETE